MNRTKAAGKRMPQLARLPLLKRQVLVHAERVLGAASPKQFAHFLKSTSFWQRWRPESGGRSANRLRNRNKQRSVAG